MFSFTEPREDLFKELVKVTTEKVSNALPSTLITVQMMEMDMRFTSVG